MEKNSMAMDMEIALANSQSESSVSKKAKMAKELGNPSSIVGTTSGSPNSDNVNGSNSDTSDHGDDNDGDDAVDDGGDYMSDYDDNDDYMFDNNDDDDDDGPDDDYLTIQAQFDNLPPGVEASFTWMKDTSSTTFASSKDAVGPPAGLEKEMSVAKVPDHANSNIMAVASSSSTLPAGLTSAGKEEAEERDIMENYRNFKRFDTVDDFSDHHYSNAGFKGQQPPRTWTKKVHDEWKMLEKGLPDTIYVRVYETRMDLLRAVISGPAGTPYHDGLFVFDVLFPTTYPAVPPMVYYYSGGLRLNPNLYDCGKVCLSLLNTWHGQTKEMWMPDSSTMLQVLVSIQALILNAKPYFNEPGWAGSAGTPHGESSSRQYNENTFILSLKTMIYTLRRPPKYYEDFVAGHFRTRARAILLACRAYMEGAEVGSLVDGKVPDDSKGKGSGSSEFKEAVSRMVNGLVSNFTRNGSKDLEEFRITG